VCVGGGGDRGYLFVQGCGVVVCVVQARRARIIARREKRMKVRLTFIPRMHAHPCKSRSFHIACCVSHAVFLTSQCAVCGWLRQLCFHALPSCVFLWGVSRVPALHSPSPVLCFQREEERKRRRAEKPVWEDTTTEESASSSGEEEDLELPSDEEQTAGPGTGLDAPSGSAVLAGGGSVASFFLAESSVDSAGLGASGGASAAASVGGSALVSVRGGAGAGVRSGDSLVSGLTQVAAELGLFRSPSAVAEDQQFEVVRRRGRWLYGQFTEFTSRTPSPTITYEFVTRFFRDGVEFDSLYATMIARRLPTLPDGVDPEDLWVRVGAGARGASTAVALPPAPSVLPWPEHVHLPVCCGTLFVCVLFRSQVQRAVREIIFRAGGTLGLDSIRIQEEAMKGIEVRELVRRVECVDRGPQGGECGGSGTERLAAAVLCCWSMVCLHFVGLWCRACSRHCARRALPWMPRGRPFWRPRTLPRRKLPPWRNLRRSSMRCVCAVARLPISSAHVPLLSLRIANTPLWLALVTW
jgi:hypothetical protein